MRANSFFFFFLFFFPFCFSSSSPSLFFSFIVFSPSFASIWNLGGCANFHSSPSMHGAQDRVNVEAISSSARIISFLLLMVGLPCRRRGRTRYCTRYLGSLVTGNQHRYGALAGTMSRQSAGQGQAGQARTCQFALPLCRLGRGDPSAGCVCVCECVGGWVPASGSLCD